MNGFRELDSIDDPAGLARVGDPKSGRDEMNLAEFPLTSLADRVPKGTKTLAYRTSRGTLLVTGSDAFGLPTAADADVIIGLLHLTRVCNNFSSSKIPFTRYELLRILCWPDESKYYRRLEESLNRWVGVTLHYQNTWWDNRTKRYLSAKMHILESVVIDERPGRRPRGAPPTSWFLWNQTFVESCQADNLKRLDLDVYFSLRSAISKRMYRFLDKRFYLRPDWVFDLKEFAFEHVGLSRSYQNNAGKIKEKLAPALEELEGANFLAPLQRGERYEKRGVDWIIRLTQHAQRTGARTLHAYPGRAVAPEQGTDALRDALIERGVSSATAQSLVGQFPANFIQEKLTVFEWLERTAPSRLKRNPAGFLVDSIRKDYQNPRGFTALSDRDTRRESPPPAPSSAARPKPNVCEKELASAWSTLTDHEREQLAADALKASGVFFRERYERLCRTDPARAARCLNGLAERQLAELMALKQSAGD